MSAAVYTSARSSRRAWQKLRTNKSALVGACLVTLFVGLALLAPVLPIADPTGTDWGAIRKPPSASAWIAPCSLLIGPGGPTSESARFADAFPARSPGRNDR
jgi:hypothetical protein